MVCCTPKYTMISLATAGVIFIAIGAFCQVSVSAVKYQACCSLRDVS